MSLFLDIDELEEVTGAKKPSLQRQRLTELGIIWKPRADGATLVLKAHLENTFGVSHKVASQLRVAPNLGAAR